jgi:sigma54-dependent transcription regulator
METETFRKYITAVSASNYWLCGIRRHSANISRLSVLATTGSVALGDILQTHHGCQC